MKCVDCGKEGASEIILEQHGPIQVSRNMCPECEEAFAKRDDVTETNSEEGEVYEEV